MHKGKPDIAVSDTKKHSGKKAGTSCALSLDSKDSSRSEKLQRLKARDACRKWYFSFYTGSHRSRRTKLPLRLALGLEM